MRGHGFCSYKEFSQQFTNKLLSMLKSWEGGGFICCLACFHDKKLMCSDICFLRLPAFKEFFDLDKAVGGEEPYLFCSYSTSDGIGNKCSILQFRFPHCCFITEGSWGFSELHSVSTCRAGANFWHVIFYRVKEGLYMTGVRFFTFLCVWFCWRAALSSQVLPSRSLDRAWSLCTLEYWWEENFQYSEFQSVLMNINTNTAPLCLSMCTKWNENHEQIDKKFCPCWSKHCCWPQQGSSCG